ncbi:MAG: flagellar assembly peptidoglycan hydrolase FlgJ [Bradyrhizobium sp.]|uniref:flagellar assembly peptidoglycan hydrolase FlgJ n=1 Tax=Bradyrhizobium sp. TaxID=376 RepID=UPI001C298D8C|nr:flagellar assembly peptidoglycan hydrolase FlgJ [Bradyrhizobium sp.]MBU6462308.1 flagellar assembly peptidoglycan hydrolase FlgJ [Pseudomonadota bacterium]MDE2067360.1 flagellar assembly peptidoglycan hydrolase FlgJ [Bradyrhizobium sp.]MDE2242787.1 flagellar assembly peptidoglycan hydrolase FlgJ [Bradyrhizobium sp.]MDE2471002.1 flagellar assembly peptidoglycan hydrolase FlgJ [Bradyrhizobium sp.]
MQTGPLTSSLTANRKPATPTYHGHTDYDMIAALKKVSPQAQAKAKAAATNFEGMFLNQMFAQMTSGLKGEGPFGNTEGTGVWRSMLTEQYSKSFAQAGGVGISNEVYRTLILQQANRAS